MSEQHQEAQFEIVKASAARLREHFDSVQILVTVDAGDGATLSIAWGEGNWFARYGQAVEWVKKQDAFTAANAKDEAQEGDET